MDYQHLDQFVISPNFRGRAPFVVQLWWLVQATIFSWSPQFMFGWRRFLLRLFGAQVGINVLIRPSARITYPWKVKIGDYSWIGDDVVLYSLGAIEMGSHVVISQKSYLCAGSHNYSSTAFDIFAKPIKLEDQVWLAADVFIAPGVRIGKGTVVGVRSTVLNDLPTGMVCYGNPAVPIKKRIVSAK